MIGSCAQALNASKPLAAKRSEPAQLFSAFISHAKADAKKAQAIAEGLEKRGFKCWIAPRDVKAGRAYGDEIIRGIESAKAFVLVLSKASNDSAFVAREVERAVSKKKPVLAIRIADVEPAPSLELFVSSTQWIDAFPGRLAPHIGRLEEEGIEPSGRAPAPEPRRLPKWALPAGAGLSVLLLLGAGIILWPQPSPQSGNDTGANPSLITTPVREEDTVKPAQDQIAMADPGPAPGGQASQGGGDAQQTWSLISQADNAELLEAFIAKFPDSFYAKLAEERLRTLKDQYALPKDPDFQSCDKDTGAAAIAACDRAIYSGKFAGRDLAYLYNDRGYLYMITGDLDRARADLDRAIQLAPEIYHPYWNRAEILRRKGDSEAAVADYQKALALGPKGDDKSKIEASLAALVGAAKSQPADKEVISIPAWGDEGERAASVPAYSYPADIAPAAPAYQAAPPMAATPPAAMPAAPAPMPIR